MITVNKLKVFIENAIKNGHGRCKICIDKNSFRSPLEADGATVLDVESVSIDLVEMADGDGFLIVNSDGSVRTKTVMVLKGD